ncbi:PQQ-binding-like beta-propeller repeat protein [Streptomyces sp. SLBN-118]|uniref:outer membrane protein assembly factor BamB family protein n=1 Tax=Streptomyces sp. SLBN-118 TaxID=2768454 RepID=UPI00135C8818|nr:PQQ-binding-like beta-propeller repeat protein [Streptomyces sp. SLBN-118]
MSSGACRQRWRLRIGDTTGLTVVDGVVYVTGNSEIYALDAATGRQEWQFSTEQYWNGLSAPTVAGGVVYFGSKPPDGHLYAMDALTGQAAVADYHRFPDYLARHSGREVRLHRHPQRPVCRG